MPGNEDRNDKLAKVRSLITLCEQNFGQCYQLSRDGAVRRSSVLEAVHAEEASEVGDQALVPLAIPPLGSVLPSVCTAAGTTTKMLPSTSATR